MDPSPAVDSACPPDAATAPRPRSPAAAAAPGGPAWCVRGVVGPSWGVGIKFLRLGIGKIWIVFGAKFTICLTHRTLFGGPRPSKFGTKFTICFDPPDFWRPRNWAQNVRLFLTDRTFGGLEIVGTNFTTQFGRPLPAPFARRKRDG
eukprot:5130930-Prymnesium_polylepis.1